MSCFLCRTWLKLTHRRRSRKAAELLGVTEFEIKNNTAKIGMKHGALAAVLEDALEMFDESGAVNYLGIEGAVRNRRFIITIYPDDGKALSPNRKAHIAVAHLKSILRAEPGAMEMAAHWVQAQEAKVQP